MFLLDNQNTIVEAEWSLDFFENSPCVVVESSGGANPASETQRRNPEYNKLLSLIFQRLAAYGVRITKVVLDSAKVAHIPVEERIAELDQPYPVDLSTRDIDQFRKMLQRQIALMHQDAGAKERGNSQKRIRICLTGTISPDQLIKQPDSVASSEMAEEYSPSLSATEKQYLRAARIGQGKFRGQLLEAYDGKCPITGITNSHLLVASHIKPWKAATNAERLNPHNGMRKLPSRSHHQELYRSSKGKGFAADWSVLGMPRRCCSLDRILTASRVSRAISRNTGCALPTRNR